MIRTSAWTLRGKTHFLLCQCLCPAQVTRNVGLIKRENKMNKIVMYLALSLLASSSIIGCTSNKQTSRIPEQCEQKGITSGTSKKPDVMKTFGAPTSKEIDADGTERWIYSSKGKQSIQTMWVRTPIQEEIQNAPDMKITEEVRGEGTNQVQKVLIIPENIETEVVQNLIITFNGDTVAGLAHTIGD